MKLKSYLASLGLAFILGMAFLPSYTLATGEDEVDTSDQEQNQDQEGDDNQEQKPDDGSQDSSDDSSGGSFIGSGMNSDDNSSQAQAPSDTSGTSGTTKPTPATPKPTPIPALPSIVPGQSTSQASGNSRPQVTGGTLTTKPTEVESEENPDESELDLPALPTVPNDNIAPTQIEAPHTGSQETPNINFAAIALLFVAGVTIMSAGIFVTIMQKAAHRAQRTL